ncbi:neuraminidase-like domain-containing protein [Pseudomonas sp. NFIX28]|uniref:Tc toxin subunit A-related protein n=1 Tax=Pseudomonas sp. NFIX28 TaxID=1566235 RepID=UPI0008992183|nr:neuraminidase-like domain-containing protein [Pseudomonas sp. NFIX28]SDZ68375.1 virulence plasmid A protein [Pseudomonas sp. NFIX28]
MDTQTLSRLQSLIEPSGINTLIEIALFSFEEFRNKVKDALSWHETRVLYRAAQKSLNESRLYEARLLSRSNPLLTHAMRSAMAQPQAQLYDYQSAFGQRASQFVAPGAVASMFSPGAYLTEMYREARALRPPASLYHLDVRRPDLPALVLSQRNLDETLSTLDLSNEVLQAGIRAHDTNLADDEAVLQRLATWRTTGATPFHDAFERTRQALLTRDPEGKHASAAPDVVGLMSAASRLGLHAGIAPELHAILTEAVTDENVEEVYERNFGQILPSALMSVRALARYYDISDDLCAEFIENEVENFVYGGYVNDQLYFPLRLHMNGDVLAPSYLERSYTYPGYHQPSYIELVPSLHHTTFELLRFRMNGADSTLQKLEVRISYGGSNFQLVYTDPKYTAAKAIQENRIPINIELSRDRPYVEVQLCFLTSREMYDDESKASFRLSHITNASVLLRINKSIRAHKATGLAPAAIDAAVASVNADWTIDEMALRRMLDLQSYMQRYTIDYDQALCLCNGDISRLRFSNQPSQFDRLFNTPPLNGYVFATGGPQIDLKPDSPDYDPRKTVLKRALQVDDVSLYRLLTIVDPDNQGGTIPNDISYLSALYRAHLLATVHQLSVDDLAMLLIGLDETSGLIGIGDDALRGLLVRLQTAVRWLNGLKWSPYELFVMTTTNYSDTLTPEIQNLLDALNNGLQDPDLSDGELIEAMAPHVAASLRLTSNEVACSVLLWVDQLQPNGMGVDAFWAAVANHAVPPAESIQFCHALAQLALVYQGTGLDANSFRRLIEQPDSLVTLPEDTTVAGHDARTLMQLSAYAGWVQRLAGNAATVLSSFEADTLTSGRLAQAMVLDEQLLRQASEQAWLNHQISDQDLLYTWPEIDIVLQWVNLANGLGVAPKNVTDWLALDYLRPDAAEVSYAAWDRMATTFTAALRTDQADTLAGTCTGSLSAALAGYYLKEVANPTLNLRSRDELYGYLLIDNQVSAQVKTARIAEATASLQLYVNRALNRIEAGVDTTVVTRRFFVEWETYNKRYSTWAGVSQLVYYPENYIDPTLRISQTDMMDHLLQSVSQSYLTSDTVGDAFNSYLTAFEQVANLDVISAYHDNLNVEQGLTYFVGCNRNNEVEYYWRSADHDKCHDGQFASNAWSEWRAINCALNPYQGVVRPVVSKSRLHLVWLEQVEQAEMENDSVKATFRYVLKLAYLRYDGTWSAPLSYPADALLAGLGLSQHEAPGLYCAESPVDETLMVLCYKIQTALNQAPVAGLYILPDLSSKDMAPGQAQFHRDNVHMQLDAPDRRRVNNRYGGDGYEIPPSVNVNQGFEWGAAVLSRVDGGAILNISYKASLTSLEIEFGALVDFRFDNNPAMFEIGVATLQTMQQHHNPGDEIWVYHQSFAERVGLAGNNKINTLVITSTYAGIGFPWSYFLVVDDGNGENEVPYDGPGVYRFSNRNLQNLKSVYIVARWVASGTQPDGYPLVANIKERFCLYTDIPASKVSVIVDTGGVDKKRFTADNYVTNIPPLSLYRVLFPFETLTIDASQLIFVNNRASVDITCEVRFGDDQLAGREFFSIPVVRQVQGTSSVLALQREDNGAQYMQWGPYRVRMNTLFARQLIQRAVRGVDAILSMDTQYLPEPPLGHGGYIQVMLPAYSPTVHGTTRGVRVVLQSGAGPVATEYAFMNTSLTDLEQRVALFVPVSQLSQGDAVDFPVDLDTGLGVLLACQAGKLNAGQLGFDPDALKPTAFIKDAGWTAGRDVDIQIFSTFIEPMDFNGANALYFWELFYYSPMLVAQRLLLEQRFDDAQRWLQYVWNPSGYVVGGRQQSYQWNVRPLEEDLGWNAESLDSTDPDAVAQYDPMHYKVATFMRWLDLLLARGDRAYRQLERDTLSEAKMWYLQALHLLGEQPYLPRTAQWSEPPLALAADKTTQRAHLQALEALSAGGQPMPLTANSLTALFLPQANDVLLGYWRTLEQRLYNLRNNLSIDGRPLALPLYATPANPKELLGAAVASSSGGGRVFPPAEPSLLRFLQMLENAKSTVSQLMQFGSSLQGIIERQDAEALGVLLQNQAKALVRISLDAQDTTLAELDEDIDALQQAHQGAQQRRDHYSALYEENVNSGEKKLMDLRMASASIVTGATTLHMSAAAVEMIPNIYGFAVGGQRFGALMNASAIAMQLSASGMMIEADKLSQSELYRRRREEWDIQQKNAQADLEQINVQLRAMALRKEAANLQKNYLTLQQEQTEAQLAFLKGKFSNEALYSWMRGRLSAIYYQFYDLAVSRCLTAEQAYQWETRSVERFIKPEWNNTYGGLLCGEALMLNLVQMEAAYLIQDARALQVVRTVSLSGFYAGLPDDKHFDFAEKVVAFIEAGGGRAGSDANGLSLENGQLSATVTLRDLRIADDYPTSMQLGSQRRIKQISVTLPALIGPYQDIQAMLSYGGSLVLPRGCEALAVSRGFDDSGQFELNFNDGRFLPFEGIPVDDGGTLTLRFPNTLGKQEGLLRTLSDIVLHIRYTIR